MNLPCARIDRFLLAAALGLVFGIVGALSIEQPPSAAIARGDFPAFYTMATLASRGEGAQLYDLEAQRKVQNEIWPSLEGSVLPVAYPAFLAFFVEPCAHLSPSNARFVWIVGMVGCVMMAGALLARASPVLRGLTWQVIVTLLLFSPLFLGVLGGQVVGLSVFLYAALLYLDPQEKRGLDIPLGIIVGLWMYKPHFALAVVVVFMVQRRWRAIGAWLVTSAGLWSLGAAVVGVEWLSRWYGFVKGFAHIDLMTNAPQMTGVVPFLYVICGWLHEDWCSRAGLWEVLTAISALVAAGVLAFVSRRGRAAGWNMGLLAVGPLLVLFAPAVNFYDLALGALPLVVLFQPTQRVDVLLGGTLIALSQVVVLLKDSGVRGGSFMLAIFLAYLVMRTTARERVDKLRKE